MVNEIKRQSTKLLPKNSNTEQTELLYTFNHIESLAFKRCNYLIVLSCKVIDIIYICECVFITFKTFVGYDGNSLFDSKSCSILNVLVWIFPPKSAPLIRLGQKLEAPQFKHHCFKLSKKCELKKLREFWIPTSDLRNDTAFIKSSRSAATYWVKVSESTDTGKSKQISCFICICHQTAKFNASDTYTLKMASSRITAYDALCEINDNTMKLNKIDMKKSNFIINWLQNEVVNALKKNENFSMPYSVKFTILEVTTMA